MYINFAPELFLEVIELTRFKESLDDKGFRLALLSDSVKFGLIKTSIDPNFSNARVERDVDNALNQKTIKIGPIAAINNQGLFITLPQTNNFTIPSDNSWYWIRIKHQYSTLEKGSVTIDATGNLTGFNTEFTKSLRSNQNFPSLIRFTNSSGNTLEYEVAEVTDDNHAVVVHPAVTAGGTADFYAETSLVYETIGTFTEGPSIPTENKRPFKYDSCIPELVSEVTNNIRPNYTIGQEFYIARVKVSAGNLVIQDKRTEYWETKGSQKCVEINNISSPLIGIESVKWQNVFNTGERNIVEVAWGMRSVNWSIDSSQNIVTFLGSSLGGSFKTTDDFTNGDFNNFRLYANNGKYSTIINSIKQGGAINLYLDTLDVDNFSVDGGVTFTGDQLLVVPDADSIELAFLPQSSENLFNITENDKFSFNINTPIGKCLPTVFSDSTCKYIVLYRFKSFKEFTTWKPIKSGSYFTEKSFESNGKLKISSERIIYSYTASPTDAFVQLEISPDSWERFKSTVYKGDIIGVNTISSFVAGQVLDLKVGVDKRYQHIVGNITLSDDIYISLSRLKAVEGNEFRIHFDCDALMIGNSHIFICDDYSSGTLKVLKTIVIGDSYQMANQDGGLVFDAVFDNEGKWIISQNYEIGQKKSTIIYMGDISEDFDATTLLGKTKGYFGWKLEQLMSGRVPVGFGTVTDVHGDTTFVQGQSNGEVKHLLTIDEIPEHSHPYFTILSNGGGLGYGLAENHTHDAQEADNKDTGIVGGSASHNIMQPYRVVAYVTRQY
jgi:microcystin-dependent protein